MLARWPNASVKVWGLAGVQVFGLLAWRRGEDGHDYEPLRAGIADRMQHAGRCQGPVTGGQALFLVAHLNQTDAFQDDVQFVLTFVSVRRVLLARLERVQSGKEKFAFGNGGLAHFAGRETGQAGDAFYKHDLQCTRAGAKVPLHDA